MIAILEADVFLYAVLDAGCGTGAMLHEANLVEVDEDGQSLFTDTDSR
jgi:hypothetical protein